MSVHGLSTDVTRRNDRGLATEWRGRCKCGASWHAATYEQTEDEWRRHVYDITGKTPRPMGNPEGRWTA